MLQQIIKNQYVVLHRLGGGGFGDTYLTEDTHKPSRPYCVVKELRPITHNPQMYHLVQNMFQREAVILENLGNSNNRIPKLYAYFFDQGKFYLVQEYIQGKTLTQMVDKATVSETIVKEILKNLLYVLNFVHSQGIIHRDIKPDNIILRESDNVPVLIDFGAVRESVGTEFNSMGQPITSKVIGTPGFMPVEQAAGRPVYSSDLYSLGLTMIYLLTGKTPLQLETDSRTGNFIWHQYAMHVSPTLKKVLDKATAYHLNERYTSAKEMIDALQVTPLPDTVVPPVYNNSPQLGLLGGGGTFNTSVSVPAEIRGWNWGAFLMPGLWVFSNHVWIGLLCFIPFLGLPIPFILGATGNTWAWRSRQWRSLQDFKAHQRAWAIAGGSVWGSLIGLFILAIMLAPPENSSTAPTLDTAITTSPTSEPTTTSPPSLAPATTTKTQEVVIGNLQAYTDKNNLFSIDIPEGWTLTDKSEPGEAIVYWQDQTGNALAQINVFAANGTKTKQEMVEILEGFLNKTVTANTNFSKSKPVFLADGTIRITWNNEVLIKGEKIRMTGNSYVEQHGDKLALYTIVVPSEQYSKLLPSIQQINASYKINALVPLPR
jgi:serine/threonine protein kinase